MFGSDDHKKDDADQSMAQVADAAQAMANNAPPAPQDNFAPTDSASSNPTPAPIADGTGSIMPTPAAPVSDPALSTPATTDAVLAPPMPGPAPAANSGELLDIKQNALELLKPLVDHLDSVPEEKFDALMMMIRASDDHSLIQPAYDTAQKIADDKKRAEALLDVVNEINYLTSTQQ